MKINSFIFIEGLENYIINQEFLIVKVQTLDIAQRYKKYLKDNFDINSHINYSRYAKKFRIYLNKSDILKYDVSKKLKNMK